MKKILSVLLAVSMLLALCIPAFAADITPDGGTDDPNGGTDDPNGGTGGSDQGGGDVSLG